MVKPKEERTVDVGRLDRERFEICFLDRLILVEKWEAKLLEFLNLHQGNMSERVLLEVHTFL